MKKIILLIFLASVLFLAGCTGGQTTTDQSSLPGSSEHKTLTVEITSEGFNPNPVTIAVGDTVTWVNKDTIEHWPASAMHPTHTVYPESGGCIGSKFDACKGLKLGESWSFTFNEKGTWNYHDHLVLGLYGKVIVQKNE
ncbi:MAG: plastocyanin/azurin family copper-binding protein [Nanoarchaeota archaeon]